MTEAEWLASDDPAKMLGCLPRADAPIPSVNRPPWPWVASDRKLRLFACACCRQAGRPTDLIIAWEDSGDPYGLTDLQWATAWVASPPSTQVAASQYHELSSAVRAALLREVFGNPFRPVQVRENLPSRWPNTEYVFEPRWLASNALAIARTIYDERRFEDMPILGDALEEAGCNDNTLLGHCQGQEVCHWCEGTGGVGIVPPLPAGPCPDCNSMGWRQLRGPHVRGCWALDLILGQS